MTICAQSSLLKTGKRITLLALYLCIVGCSSPRIKIWPAFEGVVIDAKTKEPLADVYVIERWDANMFHGTACVHVESTQTDANGRFSIPPWRNDSGHNSVYQWSPFIHKAGYRSVSTHVSRQEMVPFEGSREEYLAHLKHMLRSSGCDGAGASKRNLYPLYEALYYEAKEHSVKKSEKQELDWFRRMAARMGTATDGLKTHSEGEALREKFLEGHLK